MKVNAFLLKGSGERFLFVYFYVMTTLVFYLFICFLHLQMCYVLRINWNAVTPC